MTNIGEIDFSIMSVYLEDPITGERSCYQDELKIEPCLESRVPAKNFKVFTLKYTSEF